jgi:hypothetical protein
MENKPSIVDTVVAFGGSGLALFTLGGVIILRENLMSILGMQLYHDLITTYPKALVDILIAQGTDLVQSVGSPFIAAAGTIGLCPTINDRSDIPGAAVRAALITSMVGSVPFLFIELYEITNLVAQKACLKDGLSCGDIKDLLVFTIPIVAATIYLGRRFLEQRRN